MSRVAWIELERALALVAIAICGAACISEHELGSRARLARDGGVDPNGGVGPGAPDGAGSGAKWVFVTDGLFTGDLRAEGSGASGPEGADKLCMAEASAARLDGVFKAWISTSTEDAKARVAPVGPWRLIDGTEIFPGAAVQQPRFAVYRTPQGADLFGVDTAVWTGTDASGRRDPRGRTCADWTSRASADEGSHGYAGGTSNDWTEYGGLGAFQTEAAACNTRARLYCFQQ